MAEPIRERGYDVRASDIADYGYGEVEDFLDVTRGTDNVVTNPPFNISTEITLHALSLAKRKVCIFNKLTFLEGTKRRDKLFCHGMLRDVFVFSKRVGFGGKSGMLAFAWYVFDVHYFGNPSLHWI